MCVSAGVPKGGGHPRGGGSRGDKGKILQINRAAHFLIQKKKHFQRKKLICISNKIEKKIHILCNTNQKNSIENRKGQKNKRLTKLLM